MRMLADSMHPRTAEDLGGAPDGRGPRAPRLVLLGLFLIVLGGSLRRGHAEKRDATAA